MKGTTVTVTVLFTWCVHRDAGDRGMAFSQQPPEWLTVPRYLPPADFPSIYVTVISAVENNDNTINHNIKKKKKEGSCKLGKRMSHSSMP